MYSRNTKAALNEMQNVEICLGYSEVNREEKVSFLCVAFLFRFFRSFSRYTFHLTTLVISFIVIPLRK